MNRIIFHIDVNSAFLSWTAVDRLAHGETLDIRTVPAIIGGDSSTRHGIVLAKSVPAKAFHITTGEPVAQALRKCPTLMMVSPNHDLYKQRSHEMMALLHTYTDDIEQLSIDECFLDFTPIARQFESPVAAAGIIKERIKAELGFTVNVGIAPNKLLAKMASDFTKPDRIHTLFPEEIAAKMWPLPVDDLYMVGHSSANRLKALGIRTIGELAATDLTYLTQEFKSHGKLMWEYANGIADDKVQNVSREAKGIGNSTTLSEDVTTTEAANQVLLRLSESVATRLRKADMLAQNVTVEIKYSDFTSCSHQSALYSATNTTQQIYETACLLFAQLWNGAPLRLLGIRTTRLLSSNDPVQLSIFDFNTNSSVPTDSVNIKPASSKTKLAQLDAAMDSIRSRFGESSVVRGSALAKPQKTTEDSDIQ